MDQVCKICQGAIRPKHEVAGIAYLHCQSCNFLQNFYWDEQPQPDTEQTTINNEARTEHWPAGDADHMHEKGWGMLELMYWPLMWQVRKANVQLRQVPGYESLVHSLIRRKANRILDFGCGHGISVLELRSRDGIDAIGLDPYSPTKSPHIITTPLLETAFPSASFDGIFSIETLEHIENPLEVFTELRRILKPGGVLLVQTHRLEERDYAEQGDSWFYLRDPKTHVSIYSEPAMRRIAQKTGWKSVQFKGVKFAKFAA
ncbi:MAG: class I SAM-dependent methyltransferase [Candidatus Andersenbacteria bacterium]